METTTTTGRWKYIVAGVISMIFAGIMYAWSILKMPFGTEFGWSTSELTLNFTITMCFFCIGGLVSGFLLKRTSPKIVIWISALLTCFGFILTSRNSGVLYHLYLSYGVMCGLGIGIAYNAVISITGAWFPDRQGTCSGALMMGFGAGTLVLGNIAGSMLASDAVGWRTTYVTLGVLIGLVFFIEGCIIRYPSDDIKFPTMSRNHTKHREAFPAKDYTTIEMVKRLSFWKFFLYIIAVASVGNAVISFAKDLAMMVGAGDALSTLLVGVLSVCNGFGRIISGALADLIGRKRTMILSNILAIVAAAITLISVLTLSLPVCVLGLCLIGLSYGSLPPIIVTFMAAFYGNKYFSMNFAIVNLNLILVSFVSAFSAVIVTATGAYTGAFLMLLALSFIGLTINLSIKKP